MVVGNCNDNVVVKLIRQFEFELLAWSFQSNYQLVTHSCTDMVTVWYIPPVLDLSFFPYINVDLQTRDGYWDALLNAYCAELDKDDFVLDVEMHEHWFSGLVHVSYTVCVMIGKPSETQMISSWTINSNR